MGQGLKPYDSSVAWDSPRLAISTASNIARHLFIVSSHGSLRHRIGYDTAFGLDKEFIVFKMSSADGIRRIRIPVPTNITYRPALDAAVDRFEPVDGLHRVDFGRENVTEGLKFNQWRFFNPSVTFSFCTLFAMPAYPSRESGRAGLRVVGLGRFG